MCAVAQVINDAFRPQLLDRLDNVIEPVNMRFGQQTTVGVHRQIAIETIVAEPARDVCTPTSRASLPKARSKASPVS